MTKSRTYRVVCLIFEPSIIPCTICFGCLEMVLVAQLLPDDQNTRGLGQGCNHALPLRGGRCTGAVFQLCTRVATPLSSKSIIAPRPPGYNSYTDKLYLPLRSRAKQFSINCKSGRKAGEKNNNSSDFINENSQFRFFPIGFQN